MNYEKLYDQFIQSRMDRPLNPALYGEKHHIKPRCMGGGNEKSNIIRLSAEDHFFAHVLLAKAYGGILWAPLARMTSGNKGGFRKTKVAPTKRMRRLYALLRSNAAEAASGANNPKADLVEYHFINRDGREFRGTRHEFAKEEDLSSRYVDLVLISRYKAKSDWSTFEKVNMPGFFWGMMRGENHYAANHKSYEWVHKDGRLDSQTSFGMGIKYGISTKLAREVARGQANSCLGWTTRENFNRPGFTFGTRRGDAHVQADTKSRKWVNVDGRTFEVTNAALMVFDPSAKRVGDVTRGYQKTAKGWYLQGQPLPKSKVYKMRKGRDPKMRGVYESRKRWLAVIRRDGVAHYLGTFDTREEAHEAYCAKAEELNGLALAA